MLQDTLADALVTIKNAELVGKKECVVKYSNLIKEVLKLLKDKNYIGFFEFVNDGKGGKFKVELINKIIECKVIKPRFSIKVGEFEKWEKRFLPAREVGYLILTTPKGIIDHKRAKESNVGGKLVAYVY